MHISKRERDIRELIDTKFKPLFGEHEEQGGIPLLQLCEDLKSTDLPKSKIDRMVHSADQNKDQRITYGEFVEQMTREDDATIRKLTAGKRFLNRAVRVAVPGKTRRDYHQPQMAMDQPDVLNWGEANVDNFIEAYDCKPPPFFIPLISLAEIAVFIYYVVKLNKDPDVSNHVTATTGCPMDSPLIYNPSKRIQAWRFLTYMFIHNGYFHLVFNCLLQVVLGTLLEVVHKFWRVGIVYLLGVLGGSLAHSVSDPFTYLAGASGGCYALIGAHFASVIMNWEEMQEKWLSNPVKFFSSGVFRLIILTLLGGGDTGLAIYNRYKDGVTGGSKIGFAAHLGGFVSGILIGVPVLRNLEVKRWEKICFWVCLVLYLLFTAAAILFNGFCASSKWCLA